MTSRREFLVLACGAASIAAATRANAQLDPNQAALRRAALEEAVRKATGGAQVRRGRVKLVLPPLIDNGNSVPLSVAVESPMTASDHVKAIHVFTEKNPLPDVVSAYLAIAQMSDGSFWSDSAEVVVTLSACLEEGLI